MPCPARMVDSSSSATTTPASTASTVFHDTRERVDSSITSPLHSPLESHPEESSTESEEDHKSATGKADSLEDVAASARGALGSDGVPEEKTNGKPSEPRPAETNGDVHHNHDAMRCDSQVQDRNGNGHERHTENPLARHIVSQDIRLEDRKYDTIRSEPSSTDYSQSTPGPMDEKSLPPHPPPSIQESDAGNSSGPPALNYTLRTRKASIAFFWSLILFDSIAIPLVLYFTLHYLTDLTPNAVFSISTGCLGGISIVEYCLRFWRLWRKNSTCRVVGARRWYLDWFHWNFSIAWIFIMIELIVGTVFDIPPIRVLAMPVSSLLWWFAFELLLMDALRLMKKRAPLRVSSIPKGEPLRPGIYPFIEDVVAVDGSGGTAFRLALNERFEQSHYFRLMLHRLTLFWATGSLGIAIITTTLVFTLEPDAAYSVGWALPFVWAGVWTAITFPYVQSWLRLEKKKWRDAKVV